jgi:hypothetical protein
MKRNLTAQLDPGRTSGGTPWPAWRVNVRLGVTFVDTNILVYSHDTHDEVKHQAAENLLAQLWASGLGVLSTQVLQEFHNAATRKLQPPMIPPQARWCTTTWTELNPALEALNRSFTPSEGRDSPNMP